MAQEQQAEQVELDIDDVKEQELQVEEQKVEDKPELETVDLGYTDPIKKDVKSEVVEEKPVVEENTTDNLSSMSDKVQKRIDGLTRKMREAERREKAALDFAKGLQKKYSDAEKRFTGAEAFSRGKDIKRRRIIMPDSNADMDLLLEPLLGRGIQ